MKGVINNTLLQTFLACLFISLIPALSFYYPGLALCLPFVFLTICVIDYIRDTHYRKRAAMILGAMMLQQLFRWRCYTSPHCQMFNHFRKPTKPND